VYSACPVGHVHTPTAGDPVGVQDDPTMEPVPLPQLMPPEHPAPTPQNSLFVVGSMHVGTPPVGVQSTCPVGHPQTPNGGFMDPVGMQADPTTVQGVPALPPLLPQPVVAPQ
jgi:hypothetical protein